MAKTLGPVGSAKDAIKEGVEHAVEKATIREADQEPVVVETLPYYYPVITGEEPEYKIEKLPYYPDLDPGFHKYPEDKFPIVPGSVQEFPKFPKEGGPVPMPHFPKFPDLPKFPDDTLPRLPKEIPYLPEFPEDFDPDKGPDGTEPCPVCSEPHPENKLPIDLDPDKEPGHEIIFPERNYPEVAVYFNPKVEELCVDNADITRKRAEQAENLVQDVKSSIELDSPQAGE